jgi:HEAT repeat protein
MDMIGKFRPKIATAIPQIVKLLEDSESSVRVACAEALSRLSEHSKTVNLSDLTAKFAHDNPSRISTLDYYRHSCNS